MRCLVFFLAITGALWATPPSAAPAPKTVRIPVSEAVARDAPPLTARDFQVTTESGAEARITRVRSPKDDLLLLVVMDLVGDLSLVEPARTAIVSSIRALPATTWVGVMRAQDGLQVVLDPTQDRQKVESAIAAMPIAGKAGLLNALEPAAELADAIAAKSGVRVAILYLTDSDVRNYREDFTNPVINSSDTRDLSRRFPEGLVREKTSKLLESLTARQTPMFIAHLWYSSERLNEAYQGGLLRIADATGGQAFFARSASEIPDLVARAVDAAQSQYSVMVQLPPKAAKAVNFTVQSPGRNVSYRTRFVLK